MDNKFDTFNSYDFNTEFIYVRYSTKFKEVEFAPNRDTMYGRSGAIKKFESRKKYEAVNYILKKWSKFTISEVEEWKAPEWLKDRFKKIYNRNKVYTTLDHNGDILILFSINWRVIRISKPTLFFEIYDVYQYIFDTILFIARNSGFSFLEIYTDLVELLKLNRLYWSDSDKINIYVNITNQDLLIGGKQGEQIK